MAVNKREEWFDSSDGQVKAFLRIWEDDAQKPKFVLQLAHGMCEYADRYDAFARFICEQGGAVCCNDHLGHGNTEKERGWYGYWGKKNGEKLVVEDMHKVTGIMKAAYPGLPYFLMGHSMGSMLARLYTMSYGKELRGAIISGTSGANDLTGLIRFLANVGTFFGRGRKEAALLSYLAFNKYNDKIENPQSPNAWLTRDTAEVERYDKDPWCTFKFTDRAAYDMANLIDEVSGVENAEKLPKDLPFYLFSGEMDPVGDYTAGVKQVYGWMKQAGVNDVELKFYKDDRHETLNELDKQQVYADTFVWIKKHMG